MNEEGSSVPVYPMPVVLTVEYNPNGLNIKIDSEQEC